MEEYSKLGIANDFMFGKILQDPALCKPFLEVILRIKIDHIEILERQKSVDEKIDIHSIRMDIYVDDGKTIYNCEMQTVKKRGQAQRSRYYQGQIDMSLLKPGEDYTRLKKCFVIFICTFDPFESNRYIYTFENRCDEDPSIALNDGAIKVFINTKGSVGDVSEEFKELMHFLDTSEIKGYNTELINDLADALQNARTNEKWRHDYMSIEMLKNECRVEAKRETALAMLKRNLSETLVVECTGLSPEEVHALAATL